jgi:hypothetical protein
MASPYGSFVITFTGHTTFGRDLNLITHNTHKTQTTMTPAGFEPTIPASRWSQTHALDCAAAGIGLAVSPVHKNRFFQMTAQNVHACWELTAPTWLRITAVRVLQDSVANAVKRRLTSVVPIPANMGYAWINFSVTNASAILAGQVRCVTKYRYVLIYKHYCLLHHRYYYKHVSV